MSFEIKLDKIITKYDALSTKMMDPQSMASQEYIKIAKEHSALQEIYNLAINYKRVKKNLAESELIAKDPAMDSEFRKIAEEDISLLKKELEDLDHNIKIALLPKDEADTKNAIIEIRAGTGGEEAALFAANLFRMYQKYAEHKGWKFEVLTISETGLDGYKEASAFISGKDVFSYLKFESGVHRVQRVPETESSGRIHTSAATVAVLPEAEEVDIQINEADLKIDVYRASGAGGQHVNTTDSAVRITHIPTNTVVAIQDEKSQHKNRAKAMKILLSRIYENERHKQASARSELRKGMVGSGDRSERIRTYNYPQGRVTDHRINLTSYQLNQVINEGDLDEFINALIAKEQADLLAYTSDN